MLADFGIDILRLTLWLAILAAIFVPLERWFALRPNRAWRADMWPDIGFYFLNSLVPALLLGIPMALVAALSHKIISASYYAWADRLPLWAILPLAFIVGETGFYWGHRLMHVVPALWRYHAVHHRPAALDWLVNTRAHPIDMIFVRMFGLVPLYVIGLARPDAAEGSAVALGVVLVSTLWGFFIHANLRWRFGPFEHVLSSPRFHHWHHTLEGPIDRNFSSTLPVLDRLFGTFHLPARAWPAAYGIADRGEDDARPADA